MRLPHRGCVPAVSIYVEVRGDLVAKVGPIGGLSAKAVEDQRDLNERWNMGHRLREDAMICGDRGGGPRWRIAAAFNVAPDDDGLDGP